jgi:glutathione S-transferase
VLAEDSGLTLSGDYAITEYLEEAYEEPAMLGRAKVERAEVRRLIAWFDGKFHREVTQHLLEEKFTKRLYGRGGPESNALRAGKANIHVHLHYISWLIDRRNWLAGEEISAADLAAAAHLSCLDYLGDVPWDEHPVAKEWYARLKSRPSFRPLLADHWPGTHPPAHYANLDF